MAESAKKPAKKAASKTASKAINFEETLWDSANKLRGSVESSEYKHIVLSLIFLKFISDKFEARRQALIDEGKTPFIDMVEFYAQDNVFYLPEQARWDYVPSKTISPLKSTPPCTPWKKPTSHWPVPCPITIFPV